MTVQSRDLDTVVSQLLDHRIDLIGAQDEVTRDRSLAAASRPKLMACETPIEGGFSRGERRIDRPRGLLFQSGP